MARRSHLSAVGAGQGMYEMGWVLRKKRWTVASPTFTETAHGQNDAGAGLEPVPASQKIKRGYV